jgi:hypothetical protein
MAVRFHRLEIGASGRAHRNFERCWRSSRSAFLFEHDVDRQALAVGRLGGLALTGQHAELALITQQLVVEYLVGMSSARDAGRQYLC